MARNLSDWLKGYLEYTEDTESPLIFHKWVGISMIAAAMRKKTWLSLGRLKIYPNMYVVLVAEPGVARKSQAISYGIDIMNEVNNIVLSADEITKEALLQDLESSAMDDQLEDGSVLRHSSLSIISREFESFLGQKKDNTKMLVLLTDLFDCQEIPRKYRTKHSGSNTIPSVYLNILAATTPDSLASSLPSSAIGGGLTSRILFIWASGRQKKIAIPSYNEHLKGLRKDLIRDLSIISLITGRFWFSDECMENWIAWYNRYDELDPKRICTDPAFRGWYSRKPLFLQKLAMIFTAAKTSKKIIEWDAFELAIEFLEEVEQFMGRTFVAVGRSEVTADVAIVMNIIKQYEIIEEKTLLRMVWRDIDYKKFDNVIETIVRSGQAKRHYKHPQTGANGAYYEWVGAC